LFLLGKLKLIDAKYFVIRQGKKIWFGAKGLELRRGAGSRYPLLYQKP